MEIARDGRRQRGAGTRRTLVGAAVDVVTTSGFDRLTLREVAGRAGVSPASATYHFGTVADLLAAVVDELERRSTQRLTDLTRRSRAGELSLLDACTAYLVDLLGPGRQAYLTLLELRIRAARDPERVAPPAGQDAVVVDLIQDHVGNRERAVELFSAVVGLATLDALDPSPPDPARIRAHMARILAGFDLPAESATTAESGSSAELGSSADPGTTAERGTTAQRGTTARGGHR